MSPGGDRGSESGLPDPDVPVYGGGHLCTWTQPGAADDPPSCFAPDRNVEQAYTPGSQGCSCEGCPEGACVRTERDGRPWDVALDCVDGQWQGVEDGPCAR